jgi:hypothetical protein
MVTPENEEISQTSEVENTSKKQKERKNKNSKSKSERPDLFSKSEGLEVPYENKYLVDENTNQTDAEQSRADEKK